MRLPTCLSGAVLILGVVTTLPAKTTTAPAIGAEFHYWHLGTRILLHAETSRLAITMSDATDKLALQRRLEPLGLQFDSPGAPATLGWRLLRSSSPHASIAELHRAMSALVRAVPEADAISPVLRDEDGGLTLIQRDLFVAFAPGVSRRRARNILKAHQAGEILDTDYSHLPGVYRLRAPTADGIAILACANALATRPEVRFAEPSFAMTFRLTHMPDDPDFGVSWGLHNTGQDGGLIDFDLDATEAWDLTTGDPGVIVLVMDVGVQQDHPDLNQVPGAGFTEIPNDGGPQAACDDHGTLVAGCISGIIDNAFGSAGLAPGCRVASARIFRPAPDCDAGTFFSSSSFMTDALDWGVSIGARVSNASFTRGLPLSVVDEKYAWARAAGMVHFASSGNDGSKVIGWPASVPTVHAVGSTNRFGAVAASSTRGPELMFVAPGESIFTTDRTGADGLGGGDFITVSGTSFATAYASAVAALVISRDPSLQPSDVESMLLASTTDLGPGGWDEDSGWGMLNAFDALLAIPTDCNDNGVADGAEIAQGVSADCNGNEVPDDCDLAALISIDCDANGVPDECDVAMQQLMEADPRKNGLFGRTISLSGNLAAVASQRGFPDGNLVTTFQRDEATGNWTALQQLTNENAENNLSFAASIALSGDLLVVGHNGDQRFDVATGSVVVFRFDPFKARWEFEARLWANDGEDGDSFGGAVAIEDDVIVVLAAFKATPTGGKGCMYTFEQVDGRWIQNAKILSPVDDPEAWLFGPLAFSGDVIAVGGDAGFATHEVVHMYRRDGDAWAAEARLVPPATVTTFFGGALALQGDLLMVRGYTRTLLDQATLDSVHAYRYRLELETWVHESTLDPTGPDVDEKFGFSISMSGDLVVVGARAADDNVPPTEGCNSGAAYIYRYRRPGVWHLLRRYTPPEQECDNWFGYDVAISGDTALIGAIHAEILTLENASGFVYAVSSILHDDCNLNGVPDFCDLADNAATDCNANGVVDVCDVDCDGNGIPDECDFAAGSVADCNANFVPDACERDCDLDGIVDECQIAAGGATDCNTNLVPDHCEMDCNGNGIPDSCDLTDGTSVDVNRNRVPDECDILGDVNSDGAVDIEDFLLVLQWWGCPGLFDECTAVDIDGDGTVGIYEFLTVLANWTG